MKKLTIVCFAALALAWSLVTAETVSAQPPPYGYHCSIHPPTFDTWYQKNNGSEAVGTCQGHVNQQAINYCSGQGTTGPWQMHYAVAYMPNYPSSAGEYVFFIDSVWWQCIDGWPVYA